MWCIEDAGRFAAEFWFCWLRQRLCWIVIAPINDTMLLRLGSCSLYCSVMAFLFVVAAAVKRQDVLNRRVCHALDEFCQFVHSLLSQFLFVSYDFDLLFGYTVSSFLLINLKFAYNQIRIVVLLWQFSHVMVRAQGCSGNIFSTGTVLR